MKPIDQITHRDLIGSWTKRVLGIIRFKFIIMRDDNYCFINYIRFRSRSGKIESRYSPESNSVFFELQNSGTIELFQLLNDDIVLKIKGHSIVFKKES